MKPSKGEFPQWLVPRPLIMALNKRNHVNADLNHKIKILRNILEELRKIDRLILCETNYIECLHFGLSLEQYKQKQEFKKFSLVATEIEKISGNDVKNKFRIKIPGINEHNPVLNVSDSLKVCEHANLDAKTYYLKVSMLQKPHVIVIANKKFCSKYAPKTLYDIELVLNDFTFRSARYVLNSTNSKCVQTYIFPRKTKQCCSTSENNNERSWFNSTISNNPEQKQAVLNICAKSSFPAPYILYGPPGTGKTATVVEAVCQIWKDTAEAANNEAKHILICAPSNAACDVVANRILTFIQFNNVYRIYSDGKDYSTIPSTLKKCCNYDYEGFAEELANLQFKSKRIIITTLASSAKLILLKLNVKLSHIFIDEAGQATQPDALVPVHLVNITQSDKCQIVLSGDPQQLGPCIKSKLAETILGESILEKLMDQKPYEKVRGTGYNPNYITKLLRNYRSSADIIHVSNKLFYDNELIAYNEKIVAKFPVIFHAVKGTEEKVNSSTSSYNKNEINKVIEYVEHFLNRKIGGKQFQKKDIGIVTPFSLQSIKLRKELAKKKLKNVDVGTVEIFQGQEKEIIIVSTVRSKTFLHGKSEHIGFLSNPRRFNVALTRPKTVLVVVGNPNVLQVDRCWRYFLKFCKESKSCRGHDFELNEDDVDELLENMNLGIKSKMSDVLFGRKLRLI